GLSNVTAVAAGWTHSLALKSDGTVAAWGDNTFGESTVPPGLTNVVAIAAGADPFAGEQSAYSMALQRDGTVVAWGSGPVLELPVGMDGVMALGAGVSHASATRYGRLTPVIIHEPTNQYQISGGAATFTAVAVAPGALQYQWQNNGTNISGATNSTLTLTNVGAAQQGTHVAIISDSSGSISSSNVTFTLVTPPVITSQTLPTNQTAIFRENLTLSVAVTAPGQEKFPLHYQWSFNGTNT